MASHPSWWHFGIDARCPAQSFAIIPRGGVSGGAIGACIHDPNGNTILLGRGSRLRTRTNPQLISSGLPTHHKFINKIAKTHGYNFTPEELHSELSKQSLEELAMTINSGLSPQNT